MFKKAHSSKTSAPIRSSDLRKLRQELIIAFHLSPARAKQLAPDGLLSQKVTTHLDEPAVVYSTTAGEPLWWRPGKGTEEPLVPTCYTFDLVPDLLPILVTAPQVVEHLRSGAALFSAGVSDQSLNDLPDALPEGSLVAVVADGSPLVVAVGQLAASKQALQKDRKGKAVLTLHARGDYLWKTGSEVVAAALPRDEGVDDVTGELAEVVLDPVTEAPPAPAEEPLAAASDNASDEAPAALTPADVDAILRRALLLAIKTTLGKSPALLPMPASSLYSSYILPYRPAEHAAADIKKSSFKKLAALIKAMHKAGVLVSKEVKGELLVMSVNSAHPEVEAVHSYKTIAQAASSSAAATAAISSAAASSPIVVVKELFKPSSTVQPIFQAASSSLLARDNDLYLPSELKKLLVDYVAAANLSHPRDPKFLKLDPVLSDALLKKGEVLDVLLKDDALKRLKDGCHNWYSVQKEGEDEVLKKGAPPVVRVAVKTVGKRMVTLVSGYEAWALFSAEELADDLRHRAASSTAIQPITGSSPKKPLFEIMVQGSHEALVTKALLARGLPKAYIEVDLSKAKRN